MLIKPILSKELTRSTIPVEPALALVVEDRKLLSSIIKTVNSQFPLPSLKRVIQRDGQCLLLVCKVADIAKITSQEGSGTVTLEMREHLSASLKLPIMNDADIIMIDIPACLPLTEIQKTSSPWPVSFHPNKKLEQVLSGENFTSSERESVFARVKRVLGESVKLSFRLKKPMNCVLVASPTSEVCFASTNPNNSLQHATMVAIEKVAEIQRQFACENQADQDSSETADTQPAKKMKLETEDEMYLCTGYDVFLATEPCVMCAMALVHSRIKRLFFARWRSDFGGIGAAALHTITALNHNFEVYQVSVDDG